MQYSLFCFYNRDGMCLLRGTDSVFTARYGQRVYCAVRTACLLRGTDSVFTARCGQCVYWAVRTVCLLRGTREIFKCNLV